MTGPWQYGYNHGLRALQAIGPRAFTHLCLVPRRQAL
jgi:hypothetical protein